MSPVITNPIGAIANDPEVLKEKGYGFKGRPTLRNPLRTVTTVTIIKKPNKKKE